MAAERVKAHASAYAAVYAVVRRIPAGRVATYGQVAELAGIPRGARQAGYALHALPSATAVPWHRVINVLGAVSERSAGGDTLAQRLLLEREGVRFDARGRVSLARYRWVPSHSPRRPPRGGSGKTHPRESET